MNLEKINDQAMAVVKEVGNWIKSQRESFTSKHIEEKGLNNLVSYVDKEAEQKLVKGLAEMVPQAGFLTEEGTISQNESLWIIDPLDGTTNFVHGIPFYCVSVALAYKGEFIIGIIYDPNLNEYFHAIKGKGAYLNNKPITVSDSASLAQSVVATGFPHRSFEKMEEYVQSLDYFFRNTRSLRRLGAAALDMAYVACGRMDAFFELKLMPWDIAAGTLIVREAGGIATDFLGDHDLLFKNQIICGNVPVYNQMKQVLDQYFGG